MSEHVEYRFFLERWLPYAMSVLVNPHGVPGTMFYATGQGGHWSVQAHFTAMAAIGVLAADPDTDVQRCDCSRDELGDIYLRMLRFILQGHKCGSGSCIDSGKWGCSWISSLGFERVFHSIIELEKCGLIGEELQRDIRTLIKTEADWLLDEYEVVAHPDGHSGKNRPESNIWNGCMLLRAAELCGNDSRSNEWREKGRRFLYNGISVTDENTCEDIYSGKPLRDWHAGGNFFPSMALHHHGYLNVGYMVICLSNIAMMHFQCKQLGITPPPEIYFNAGRLWDVVRDFVSPDGRLLRVGGDTRIRYCYCQDYLVPALMWVRDYLGGDTSMQESGWLNILHRETSGNADGSFLGNRLAVMKNNSCLYHLRLEGDRAASLSMAALWKRLGLVSAAQDDAGKSGSEAGAGKYEVSNWEDGFHGAVVASGQKRMASWVWEAAQKPQGMCVPLGRSDMAEWQHNLAGEIYGDGAQNAHEVVVRSQQGFAGGFCACGKYSVKTFSAMYEGGEYEKDVAECSVAVAALPDDATFIGMQYGVTTTGCVLRGWRAMHLLLPNDIFNEGQRRYRSGKKELLTESMKGHFYELDADWLVADNALSVGKIYGSEPLSIYTPAERQVMMKNSGYSDKIGGSLCADEICIGRSDEQTVQEKGSVLFDCGFVLCCNGKVMGSSVVFPLHMVEEGYDALWRGVHVAGADGCRYTFIANFSGQGQEVEFSLAGAKSYVCLNGDVEIMGSGEKGKIHLDGMQSLLLRVNE